MKKFICFFFMILLTISIMVFPKETKEIKSTKESGMKIKLVFEDTVLTATMYNNSTAKDFLSLLPLKLKLEDYHRTEKISQIPKKLSLQNSPSGYKPFIGDIAYYSPWGNLAIFYKDFSYSEGLILLGRIDSNINFLEKWNESKSVTIERINSD